MCPRANPNPNPNPDPNPNPNQEIAEMKRKFKTMTRHIEQLKVEIDSHPNPGP